MMKIEMNLAVKEMIEKNWRARRAPLVDGIVFPSGRTLLVDYVVQSDAAVFDFGVHGVSEVHLFDALCDDYRSDDAWTPLLTVFSVDCPEHGLRLEVGEGASGCYGFVACCKLAGGVESLLWLGFLQESNPFVRARCRGKNVEAMTNLDHTWIFPIDAPGDVIVLEGGQI